MAGLLEGKAGIVTGAAGGIGRGIAIELAREGAYVLVSDLEPEAERAQETIALCQEAGGEAAWQACDVTSAEAQDALVGDVLRTHGRLDFAVNNAGVAVHKPLTEVTDQEYSRVLDINLKGIFLGMRPQVRQMVEQGGGSIVNMASVAGLTGVRDIGVYTASKHGIVGLTKNTAMEYGERGVQGELRLPERHPHAAHGHLAAGLRGGAHRPAGDQAPWRARGGRRGRRVPALRQGLVHHRRRPADRRRLHDDRLHLVEHGVAPAPPQPHREPREQPERHREARDHDEDAGGDLQARRASRQASPGVQGPAAGGATAPARAPTTVRSTVA